MKHVILLLFTAAALGTLVSTARAEQYWIAYEGNDLPENEGWQRRWGDWEGPFGEGAFRTVDDGILTIDSLHDQGVYDFARFDRPGQLDPGPGELFVIEWQLKVDQVISTYGSYDPSVSVHSDDGWIVGFGYYEDGIESKFENDAWIPITPGVFHEYQLYSLDMRTYELYIDGVFARQGEFWDGLMESYVTWGDAVSGAASLSHWDYLRFGVVPEPCSLFLLTGLLFCTRCNRV